MPVHARLSGDHFLLIGRAGMDFYADPPGSRIEEAARFTVALGGSSANIAVALVRQGARADLLTCVSDDAVGRFCLSQLDAYGVGRTHIRRVRGETRTSLSVVETRWEDCQSVIYRNGAADFEMTIADVEAVDFTPFSAVIVTGTALAAEPSRAAVFKAFERARHAGVTLILDVDYRPYSWVSATEATATYVQAAALCDVIVGNDVEFGFMAGDYDQGLSTARLLVRGGASLVIFKMGEHGAITITADSEFRTGIFKTQARKPTGAGDSFLAGVLVALAAGCELREAVVRGSAAAAIVVTRVGCAPAMPTAAEIDAFLADQPEPMLL